LIHNEQANANVLISNSDSLVNQEVEVVEGLTKVLDGRKLDAIICVAGGWAGGSAANKGFLLSFLCLNLFKFKFLGFLLDFIKNSELMIRQSVWSSLIAAKIASKFLNENGLLTLTGAKAALEPTPGMHSMPFSKCLLLFCHY